MRAEPNGHSRPSFVKAAGGLALGVCCGLALFAALDVEYFKNQLGWNRQRNHRELQSLQGMLALGDTQDDIRAILARSEFQRLQLLNADPGSQEWWIYTPLEFGAGNWILGLQFTGHHLSAIHFRTADEDVHPDGAPADEGTWLNHEH